MNTPSATSKHLLVITAAFSALLGACSDGAGSGATTVAPVATEAPTTNPAPTTTTTAATTTTAPPTTTTTTSAPDGPPPPVSATITNPENPDPDEVAAVAKELWAHYQWWLAHPEEPLDSFVTEGGQAGVLFSDLQAELLRSGEHLVNGLTMLGVSDIVTVPNGVIGFWVEVRRDEPRVRIDSATGDVVVVEEDPDDTISGRSLAISPQPDGTYRVTTWGGTPFGVDVHAP